MSPRTADPPSTTLALALSPHGAFHLADDPDTTVPLEAAVAARLRSAFARGPGAGLLHLGAAELTTPLPATLAFGRDLGRLFMGRLCAQPDLEERRARVDVPLPGDELPRLLAAAPPMSGGEYLDLEVLQATWEALLVAARRELETWKGTVQAWLQAHDPVWNQVGRVCFHLAENKRDAQAPFAFLATYAARLSDHARVQHVPLGRALEASSGRGRRDELLTLLQPVQRAAARCAWVRELVDAGEVFHPLAWTAAEAYRFLKDAPELESCGLVVRMPDWWNRRQPPRPQVNVTVGTQPVSRLGMATLLDFQVRVVLDGEALTAAELRQIQASTEGLALVRGRWVEVDRERLSQVLDGWQRLQRAAREGLSFAEAMRLLAGAPRDPAAPEDDVATAEWSRVVAGKGLAQVLEGLRNPQALARAADPGPALKAHLRPYQETGLRWLWFLYQLGLGGCLADDMGLGKTVQVLALLLATRRLPDRGTSLLVVPASLLANWKAEAARFAPSLKLLIAHPSEAHGDDLQTLAPADLARYDAVVTSYGQLLRLPALAERAWDLVVLDEAQAIKNPAARQTRAAKALQARCRLLLTGTPVENRLSDLWSLFDFACPGLLGSAKAFREMVKRLEQGGGEVNWAPLRALVRPWLLRRLKTDRTVIADLPDKTELRAFCPLSRTQAVLYQQSVAELADKVDTLSGIERRGLILAYLMRFKQICNHPSHWLGDHGWAPEASGKFGRLREICEEIAARQDKVLVFTQFREVTAPLAAFLARVFGRPGLVLHGETAMKKRRDLVADFQRDEGPPFLVATLKVGGTGLNLTAASHVVHFDRWWNPAVENQATDRAFRIGQRRNVLVHKLVCRGTVEERIDELIRSKTTLAGEVVQGGGEALLTELPTAALLKMVSLDIHSAMAEG